MSEPDLRVCAQCGRAIVLTSCDTSSAVQRARREATDGVEWFCDWICEARCDAATVTTLQQFLSHVVVADGNEADMSAALDALIRLSERLARHVAVYSESGHSRPVA